MMNVLLWETPEVLGVGGVSWTFCVSAWESKTFVGEAELDYASAGASSWVAELQQNTSLPVCEIVL